MIWKAWRQEVVPLVGLVLALVGLFSDRIPILMIGLFFLVLSWLSSRLAQRTLERLTVTSRLRDMHCEIGESVNAEMIVKNPLPWPILDVEWKIDLPQTVEPQGPGTTLRAPGGARQTLTGTLWVGARQRIRIQYRLTGLVRGRWNVGPGSLIFRDPLSWNELIREDSSLYHVTVWPQRYTLPQSFWSQQPLPGTRRGNPWDPPDPLSVVAIRPYQPGDSVRQIASYASARMRQLMVKQLEPISERTVEVLIHPKTSDHHWEGIDRALIEDTISAAATIVESAVNDGLVTGLSGTGSIPGHVRGYTLPLERRTSPEALLTALAWIQPSGTMDDDMGFVLARLEHRISTHTTLVIVSPYWPDALSDWLSARPRRALKVIYVKMGDLHDVLPTQAREIWQCRGGRWARA